MSDSISRMSRVAWVTGGGRGIGRAIALALADAGLDVAVSARSMEELTAVADEVESRGQRGLAIAADVMSFDDTRASAQAILRDLGPIDVLVNNAGGGVRPRSEGSPEQIDDQAFVDNVSLNLFSAYRATQAVLGGMVERRYGRIINIGSGYAKRSGGAPAYTAAKHGLIGMTRAMAAQVATQGVTINCLCPGWTNTKLVNMPAMPPERVREIESENLQQRVLEPEELGPMAALLASEAGGSITGQVISVDGGYGV